MCEVKLCTCGYIYTASCPMHGYLKYQTSTTTATAMNCRGRHCAHTLECYLWTFNG